MADFPAGRIESAELALCLAFELRAEERWALRMRMLDGGWSEVLELARRLRLDAALAAAVAAKGLAAGIPQLQTDGQLSISAAFEEAAEQHRQRHAVLRQRLAEVLQALAERGLYPVLLKGARALWLGTPSWRSLRDLDLLVPQPDTDEAVRVILAMGYRLNEKFVAPVGWHHDAELYRDDLPGWIEIHARGGLRRMEFILPTPQLETAAIFVEGEGGVRARVLPIAEHILHCLTHHHIGHRGDYSAELDFKGLYEFAGDVAALDLAERAALLEAAARHPRLMAALDLWLAAAADIFDLRVEAPLQIAPDASERWARIVDGVIEREQSGRKPRHYEGLRGEAQMALEPQRLKRLHGGGSVVSRMALRVRALRALTAKASVDE